VIYETRSQKVEAEPVVLAGEKMMAVAFAGAAHLVSADMFGVFFRPEVVAAAPAAVQAPPAAPAKQPRVKPAQRKLPAARPTEAASGPPNGKQALTTGDAVTLAVKEGGHTQATAIDRACTIMGWDPADKVLRDRVYQNIWMRVKSGKLVKRDDPKTHLPVLHLGEGGD